MIAVEVRVREGSISREEGDRLLNRFAAIEFKVPKDVYREYMMEGSRAATGAKVRKSFESEVRYSLFKNNTDNIVGALEDATGTVGDKFLEAAGEGAAKVLRKKAGLDGIAKYRFTSEKPAHKGEDPRPWENVTTTTHELVISDSAPVSILFDMAEKFTAQGDGDEQDSTFDKIKASLKKSGKDIVLDTAKNVAIQSAIRMVLAGVKVSAKAAVMNWIKDPENLEKLIIFMLEHSDTAVSVLVNTVEWMAEHPDATKEIFQQAQAIAKGSTFDYESFKFRKITWKFVDGKLDSFAYSKESTNKMGFDIDPVGIGLSAGFDLSYGITETVNTNVIMAHPTLTSMLGTAEQYLYADTSMGAVGSSEGLKNFLAANLGATREVIASLNDERNVEIYNTIMASPEVSLELKTAIQDARREAMALTDADPDDRYVDTLNSLLNNMTLAYRQMLPEAA